MELTTIEVPQAEAIKRFREYREAVRHRHSEEDAAIMRGYKALATGRRLIRLSETIKAGGTKEVRRVEYPALAVCEAEARQCWCRVGANGSVQYSAFSTDGWRTRRRGAQRFGVTDRYVSLRPGTMPASNLHRGEVSTIVPIVPPALRPARGLAGYHLLWEVDEWRLVPPVDPALIKHIEGDLWAVVAVWDLTELERAVLMGRAR